MMVNLSTSAKVPWVSKSFLGQADQNLAETVSPVLNVTLTLTSATMSPNLAPNGVESMTTGGSKPICLLRRSGGGGPASTVLLLRIAAASFWNSWM